MSTLILLVVGAAWAAVLLPPLFRSRFESMTTSSVSDFRRQLHTLQRTQSRLGGQSSMRAMARPLAPDMRARRPRQLPAPMFDDVQLDEFSPMPRSFPQPGARSARQPARRPEPRAMRNAYADQYDDSFAMDDDFDMLPTRSTRTRVSAREAVRRRRQKALNTLGGVTATALFLALTTGNGFLLWVFALSAVALVAYCYMLVQMRHADQMRRYYNRSYDRRAA